MDRQQRGRWGEEAVARALARAGFRIVARNVRMQRGELDLIAHRDRCLWFVETKARGRRDRGSPALAITPKKRKALFAAAREYLVSTGFQGNYGFLAAWVVPDSRGRPCVRWNFLPISPSEANPEN